MAVKLAAIKLAAIEIPAIKLAAIKLAAIQLAAIQIALKYQSGGDGINAGALTSWADSPLS